MKNRNQVFVSAVFLKGKSFLVCRELALDDYPKSGFHFPGGSVRPGSDLKTAIKELIFKKYGTEIRIMSALTPVFGHGDEGKTMVLYPFICENISPFLFPSKRFSCRYLPFDEISSLYFDRLDKALAEKIALYYPLFSDAKPAKEKDEHEKREIGLYLDSLAYFDRRLPPNETKDFSSLTESAASLIEIRKAYKWLLERYDLDYNEYLDVLDYRKKHRGH